MAFNMKDYENFDAYLYGSEEVIDDGVLDLFRPYPSTVIATETIITPRFDVQSYPYRSTPQPDILINRTRAGAGLRNFGTVWYPEARAGFKNLGDTCFVNAVVQCFIHIVPFAQGILSDNHSLQCGKTDGSCLLCILQELTTDSFSSMNKVIEPRKLVNSFKKYFPTITKQQEDAHEFFHFFLNDLKSCYDPKGDDNTASQSNNLVQQVFDGHSVVTRTCCNCTHSSHTRELFIDLSLGIKDSSDLLKALESFIQAEKVEYTCDGCKKTVLSERRTSLDQVPSAVSFNLKRYEASTKIDKHVEFPLELNLTPFTVSSETNDKELNYELHSVVVHTGQTVSVGHYYCLIRIFPGKWFKFDDDHVAPVDEKSVLKELAYILFYVKKGTTWFSDFIKTYQESCKVRSNLPTPISVLPTNTSQPSPGLQQGSGCQSKHDVPRLVELNDMPPMRTILPGAFENGSSHEPMEEDALDITQTPSSPKIEGEGSEPGRGGNGLKLPQKRQLEEDCDDSRKKKKSKGSGDDSREEESNVAASPTEDPNASLIASALHPWIAKTFRYS